MEKFVKGVKSKKTLVTVILAGLSHQGRNC